MAGRLDPRPAQHAALPYARRHQVKAAEEGHDVIGREAAGRDRVREPA
jgi:hypothetical protein